MLLKVADILWEYEHVAGHFLMSCCRSAVQPLSFGSGDMVKIEEEHQHG
ncbi:hypothetical protein [Oryzifoliimicrobium ureilyticus]